MALCSLAMLAVTVLVASIGLGDSINPSTIVPALWLVSDPRGSALGSYIAGVFVVYFAGGVVLVLGPGPALIRALRGIGGPFEHALEAAGGVALLIVAVVMWRSRRTEHHRERPGLRPRTRRAAFSLGAGIMVLELPTAFVYFGAITAILAARPAAPGAVALVLVYNVCFVVPLLAILAVSRLAGSRAEEWLRLAEDWLRRFGRVAIGGVAAVLGTALLALGAGGAFLA
jgi:cytochrome c biogenesis protein CcdA